MNSVRVENWQPKLHAFLMDAQRRKFEYGVYDCALLVKGAIDAMSGVELEVQEVWSNQMEAYEFVSARGLNALVCKYLGEPIPAGWCGAGDVGLYIAPTTGLEGLAVHDGSRFLAPDAVGLATIPLQFFKHGWRT